MLSGLKNFAINRVLRHVADNAKLNVWTNWISVVLLAALGANANWTLLISEFSKPSPAGLAEVVRVAGIVAGALLLYLVGKFPMLKAWLPTAQEIIAEAESEAKPAKQP